MGNDEPTAVDGLVAGVATGVAFAWWDRHTDEQWAEYEERCAAEGVVPVARRRPGHCPMSLRWAFAWALLTVWFVYVSINPPEPSGDALRWSLLFVCASITVVNVVRSRADVFSRASTGGMLLRGYARVAHVLFRVTLMAMIADVLAHALAAGRPGPDSKSW